MEDTREVRFIPNSFFPAFIAFSFFCEIYYIGPDYSSSSCAKIFIIHPNLAAIADMSGSLAAFKAVSC
jgi:hypothetical protein